MSIECGRLPSTTDFPWRRSIVPHNVFECTTLETRKAKQIKSAIAVRKEILAQFIQPLMSKTSERQMSLFLDKSAQPFNHLFFAYCEILLSVGTVPQPEPWADIVARLFTTPSNSFSEDDLFRVLRATEISQQVSSTIVSRSEPPARMQPDDVALLVRTLFKLNLLFVAFISARGKEVRVARQAGSFLAGLADKLGETLLTASARIGLLDDADEPDAVPADHDEETYQLAEAGVAEYAAILDSN